MASLMQRSTISHPCIESHQVNSHAAKRCARTATASIDASAIAHSFRGNCNSDRATIPAGPGRPIATCSRELPTTSYKPQKTRIALRDVTPQFAHSA